MQKKMPSITELTEQVLAEVSQAENEKIAEEITTTVSGNDVPPTIIGNGLRKVAMLLRDESTDVSYEQLENFLGQNK